MALDPIRVQLNEMWGRLSVTNDGQTDTDDVPFLIDALRAVLDLCNELDDRARVTDTSLSYDDGWVDGVFEATTAIETAIAQRITR